MCDDDLLHLRLVQLKSAKATHSLKLMFSPLQLYLMLKCVMPCLLATNLGPDHGPCSQQRSPAVLPGFQSSPEQLVMLRQAVWQSLNEFSAPTSTPPDACVFGVETHVGVHEDIQPAEAMQLDTWEHNVMHTTIDTQILIFQRVEQCPVNSTGWPKNGSHHSSSVSLR